MTASPPLHRPFHLLGVFAASVLAFGLVASAAGAALYIYENERPTPEAAPAPAANVDLPEGLVLIQQVESAADWERELQFAPVVPETLPEGVVAEAGYYLQQPDSFGRRAGHVRYAYGDGAPAIVLIEQAGTISAEPPMKALESSGKRSHIVTFACGSIVIQAQVYFDVEGGAVGSPKETAAIAEGFVTGLRSQCD